MFSAVPTSQPDERDVLDLAGVHGQAVVVPVHLEEQVVGVAVVGDLVAEHAGRVRPPGIEIDGRDPDVAELVDFAHVRCVLTDFRDRLGSSDGPMSTG